MTPAPGRKRVKAVVVPPVVAEAIPEQVIPFTDGITSYRWIWYLLSIFIPFAGILVALFLYDQESWNVRKIGRHCLLIAFVVWIFLPILAFLAVILIMAVAMAGVVSNALSPVD